jgi:tight adherence protein C
MAAKTPVKLVFPLLLFIFPAIMVVLLGPAFIQVSEFFSRPR